MALDPLEIAIIVGAIVIFLIWGPSKIPELARSLGRARSEFSKASKASEADSTDEPKDQGEKPDDELVLVAQSLGISTEGKTKSQLAKEIIDKKAAK